jgi:fumarate hydratase class II
MIKYSAAAANSKLKLLPANKSNAIKSASKDVLNGLHDDSFPLDVFQTGSGTSTNMNANEVIANLATKKSKLKINANDDVNMSQSSNDVIPTAICISALIDMNRLLLPNLDYLIKTIDLKMNQVKGNVKTGRTHLMDAMPIDFSQELSGWKAQLEANKKTIIQATNRMNELPQGGTAIGTGINAHKDFSKNFCSELNKLSKFKTKPTKNFYQGLSSVDNAVELSSAIKNLSVILMKISNDLRWMNSGPLTGLGEIELQAMQPGSSIMPGKVNPVIPEAVAMACADVIGNDVTVTLAGQSGNFQLNVMLPVVAYNILKSINLLGNAMPLLANKAIKTFKVNSKNINESLSKNPILVTALNRVIGYSKAAAIAKKAYKENKSIIDAAHEETGINKSKLKKLLDPLKLTKGGISE